MENARCVDSMRKAADPEAGECRRSVKDKNSRTRRSGTVWCLSLVVVSLTALSGVAVACCVRLYGEVKAQGEMVQNLRKDYTSLRRQVEDSKVVASSAVQLGGQATSLEGIWQILGQRDDLPDTIRRQLSTRRKRNAHGRGNSVSDRGSSGYEQTRLFVESLIEQYHQDMPKVHLQGLDSGETNHVDNGTGLLLWTQAPHAFHRVGVNFEHDTQSEKIKTIRIHRPGIYLVYAQVVINGTAQSTYRRDCSHETVVLPHSESRGGPRILMSGYLTQDEEGRSYEHTAVPSHPRDSSLQMGLFRLLRQDRVGVKIPHHNGECRFVNFATHMHASYFGLYKIE